LVGGNGMGKHRSHIGKKNEIESRNGMVVSLTWHAAGAWRMSMSLVMSMEDEHEHQHQYEYERRMKWKEGMNG